MFILQDILMLENEILYKKDSETDEIFSELSKSFSDLS